MNTLWDKVVYRLLFCELPKGRKRVKILHVAVFDNKGISADTSAAMALSNNENVSKVIGYNYRQKVINQDISSRDDELINLCKTENPDLVFFVKCNSIHLRVFEECKKICPIAYWFADPLVTFLSHPEFSEKAKASDCVFVDKENVFDEIKTYNDKVFIVPDGFDAKMEYPVQTETQDLDVSFIGQLYGDRLEKVKKITYPVSVISNVYGFKHARAVAKSKINLNFCTSDGPSNRVYKVLASKGFLLSDDWYGREEHFEDGKHLVIFNDVVDLNEKIKYYLSNEKERNKIAKKGHSVSHKYTRDVWAAKCLEILKTNNIVKAR